MPTLALLGGHSLAYRAFNALPPDLATKSEQVTNAVFGFTSMLIKLLGDHDPEGMVVAWDVSCTTFGTEAYPLYKAKRRSMPENSVSERVKHVREKSYTGRCSPPERSRSTPAPRRSQTRRG